MPDGKFGSDDRPKRRGKGFSPPLQAWLDGWQAQRDDLDLPPYPVRCSVARVLSDAATKAQMGQAEFVDAIVWFWRWKAPRLLLEDHEELTEGIIPVLPTWFRSTLREFRGWRAARADYIDRHGLEAACDQDAALDPTTSWRPPPSWRRRRG